MKVEPFATRQNGPSAPTHGVAFVDTLQTEFESGSTVNYGWPTIEPVLHGDEANRSRSIRQELDESRSREVEYVTIPQIGLFDSPPSEKIMDGSWLMSKNYAVAT